jgi:hypothetical protein
MHSSGPDVPFAPLPVWDATREGTIVSGDGRFYDPVETDRYGADRLAWELAAATGETLTDVITVAIREPLVRYDAHQSAHRINREAGWTARLDPRARLARDAVSALVEVEDVSRTSGLRMHLNLLTVSF